MESKEVSYYKKCSDLVKSFIDEIFPFLDNCRCNKVLEAKICELSEIDLQNIQLNELYEKRDLTHVPLNIIKEGYNKTLERKRVIENKAKTNVLGVTVCVTLSVTLADNIDKIYTVFSSDCHQFIFYVCLIGAMLYLFSGGWLALKLLMCKNKIYLTYDEEQILPEITQKKIYIRNTILNEKSNLIRANYMNTSYQSIRNGLLIFTLIFIVCLRPGINKNKISEEILILKTKIEVLEYKNNKLEANTMLLQEYVKKLENRLEKEIVNKQKVTGVNTIISEKKETIPR